MADLKFQCLRLCLTTKLQIPLCTRRARRRGMEGARYLVCRTRIWVAMAEMIGSARKACRLGGPFLARIQHLRHTLGVIPHFHTLKAQLQVDDLHLLTVVAVLIT